jgi:hypothetical protein
MSEITIHKNLYYAVECFNNLISNKDVKKLILLSDYYRIPVILHNIVLNELLCMQHKLFKYHLADRYYNDLKLDVFKMSTNEVSDRWFTFLYETTLKASLDEIFEIQDAFDGYNNVLNNYTWNEALDQIKKSDDDIYTNDNDYRLSKEIIRREPQYRKYKYLVVEEIIDLFHFFLQFITIVEEHKLSNIYLLEHDKITNTTFYDYIINPKNETFINETYTMLSLKSTHIKNDYFLDFYCSNCSDLSTRLLLLVKYARDLMRKIKWKPWKNYPDNYYDTTILGNITESARYNYKELLHFFYDIIKGTPELSVIEDKHISDYIIGFNEIKEYIRNNPLCTTITMLYIIYMSKNKENIERQNNNY